MRIAIRSVAIATLYASMILPVLSDAPLGTPRNEVCSFNQRYCGRFEAAANMTRIGPAESAKGDWSVAGRPDGLVIANSGKVAARMPVTANILPMDAKPDTPVIVLLSPDRAPKTIVLGQLVDDIVRLPRTTSGIHWASTYGFEPNGLFLLETSQGVVFRIDPIAGTATNRPYFR